LKVTSSSAVAATALQTRPGEYATLPVAPNFGQATNGSSPARLRAARAPLQNDDSLNQKLYFPQFANGGLGGTSIFSQAILINLTSQDANTKLILKKASGDPFTVKLNGETVAGEKELVIPAGGLAVLESDGEGDLSEGSLTVCSDQALAGVVLFVGSAQAGTAGVGSSSLLLRGFWAPLENNAANSISTGLAVMNLEEETVELDLTLCDADGNELATGELSIPAMGQETFFLWEVTWQPNQGVTLDFTDFIGLVKVSADGNTAAAVVQTRPGVFATLPVVPPLE